MKKMKKEFVTAVRLDKSMTDTIDNICEKEDRNRSNTLRVLIREALTHREVIKQLEEM